MSSAEFGFGTVGTHDDKADVAPEFWPRCETGAGKNKH